MAPTNTGMKKLTPRRVTQRKRSRTDDPKMMLAYKPTKATSILDVSRPRTSLRRSAPPVRQRHDELPATLARPVEPLDIFAAVEIGPAFPAPQIGPSSAETERDEFDWDARFGELHGLISITENEIRCWEEFEEVQQEERITDNVWLFEW